MTQAQIEELARKAYNRYWYMLRGDEHLDTWDTSLHESYIEAWEETVRTVIDTYIAQHVTPPIYIENEHIEQ
jgi:hypothetical protein